MTLVIIGAVLVLIGSIALLFQERVTNELVFIIGFFGTAGPVIFLIFIVLFGLMSSMNHANDLGTLRAQKEMVAVYQERVASLDGRLKAFDFPRGSLLNADSPVATIVASLSEAEKELATVNAERAKAIRSIAQRKAGVFSVIVDWMGEE
jgi:hypothetical protein